MYTQSEFKACVPGFTSRVDKLFDTLGIRPHGRAALLADWTGMSRSGAAKMYREDRPPGTSEAINKLAQGFTTAAATLGTFPNLHVNSVARYLLNGGDYPLSDNNQHVRKFFSKLSVVSQAKVYLLLNDFGKKRGIDFLNDLSSAQLVNVIEKMSQVHLEKSLGFDAAQWDEILDALIKLAQSDISL